MPDTSPDPARIAAWEQLGDAQWRMEQAGGGFYRSQEEQDAHMRARAGEQPACSLAELPDWVFNMLIELFTDKWSNLADADVIPAAAEMITDWATGDYENDALLPTLRAALRAAVGRRGGGLARSVQPRAPSRRNPCTLGRNQGA